MNYTSVGKFGKSYGLKGMLKTSFEAFFIQFIEELQIVFIEIKAEKVPYFIDEIDRHGNGTYYLKFEGIDSKEEAYNFTNKEIFVDADKYPDFSIEEVEAAEWDYLLEYVVVEDEKQIGEITEIFYMPHQDMMEIKMPDNQTFLMPLHENLIVQINKDQKTIHLDIPDGLLEL